MVLLDLTVFWEDLVEELFEKTSDDLVSNCQKGGWRARCFPIKVRCCISSLSRAPCIVGVDKQRIICNITEAEAVS